MTEIPDKRQLAIPCDCIGSCSIALITEWEQYGKFPQECFIEFYRQAQCRGNYIYRLKKAWDFFRGKDVATDGLCLNSAQLAQLRDFMIEITDV